MTSGATDAALVARAEASGLASRADLTVANDLTTVRDGRHVVHLVRAGEPPETLGPRPDLADAVVARVFDLAASPGRAPA